MPAITDVLAVPVTGGYYFDDQAAIKAGAVRDGLSYPGAIRRPAAAVSVLLRLGDGHVAHGDCVSVQYSGAGGREPALDAPALAAVLDRVAAPALRGRAVGAFRPLLDVIDGLGAGTAAGYGLSQALLDACAHASGRTMAELVQDEWRLDGPLARVPVFAQTGEDRAAGVDKMIMKRVDSLPHGLINEPALVGEDGSALRDYVAWVRDRVVRLRGADDTYAPVLHFDVYGLLGPACGGDPERLAAALHAFEAAAAPFRLRIEHPLDAGGRDAQIRALAGLRARLAERGAHVQLVADEWANTVEDIRAFNRAGAADVVQIKLPDLGAVHHAIDAVLDCRAHGVVAHVGGSCCETERAAQVSVHVALGAHADQVLAKPGMGVDEGLSIVRNEMERTLRLSRPTDERETA